MTFKWKCAISNLHPIQPLFFPIFSPFFCEVALVKRGKLIKPEFIHQIDFVRSKEKLKRGVFYRRFWFGDGLFTLECAHSLSLKGESDPDADIRQGRPAVLMEPKIVFWGTCSKTNEKQSDLMQNSSVSCAIACNFSGATNAALSSRWHGNCLKRRPHIRCAGSRLCSFLIKLKVRSFIQNFFLFCFVFALFGAIWSATLFLVYEWFALSRNSFEIPSSRVSRPPGSSSPVLREQCHQPINYQKTDPRAYWMSVVLSSRVKHVHRPFMYILGRKYCCIPQVDWPLCSCSETEKKTAKSPIHSTRLSPGIITL